jgi:uncharacterized membrane protein
MPQHEQVETTRWVAEGAGEGRPNRRYPTKWVNSDRSFELEQNVQAIRRWERTILLARSKAEQAFDWIASTAGRGQVFVLLVVWFGAWVNLNYGCET